MKIQHRYSRTDIHVL